jgi:hypothetical protein
MPSNSLVTWTSSFLSAARLSESPKGTAVKTAAPQKQGTMNHSEEIIQRTYVLCYSSNALIFAVENIGCQPIIHHYSVNKISGTVIDRLHYFQNSSLHLGRSG